MDSQNDDGLPDQQKPHSSVQQGPVSGQIKHRRKKNEIEKDYICGDPNCSRRYGTNAALYTHIKNKHNGIAPTGTIKPTSSQKKAQQLGNPEQQTASHPRTKINGNVKDDEEEKLHVLEITSHPSYLKFSLTIGRLGSLENDNLLVRQSTDEYYSIKDEQVQEFYTQMIQKIQMSPVGQVQNYNHTLSKLAAQFLVQTSPYWRRNAISELYLFLIYSYVFEGRFLEIVRTESDKYPIFVKLLASPQRSAIEEAYTNIWKGIASESK